MRRSQRKPFEPITLRNELKYEIGYQHFVNELPIPSAGPAVPGPKWPRDNQSQSQNTPDPHATAQTKLGHAEDSPPSPGTETDEGGIPLGHPLCPYGKELQNQNWRRGQLPYQTITLQRPKT
jgi:hypothetical protein